MKFYLAPLEGITGYVYRQVYQEVFHNIDQYYIPFVEPHIKRDFNAKEEKELSPEQNQGFCVIPQILTKNSEDFIRTAKKMSDMGYRQVNLNLGCPSGTVVSKGKGAGFLEFPEQLDRFLDEIFSAAPCEQISIKTRIGRYEPEEFERLLSIYEKYPIHELIIHPRTREDYYKNIPHYSCYQYAVDHSSHRLCYNGDIFTVRDYQRILERFPDTAAVMLGRGIIGNPCLVDEILGQERDMAKIRHFHDRLYEEYRRTLSGDRPLLFKMKEIWCYGIPSLGIPEKTGKQLKKVQNRRDYEDIVRSIFQG